MLVVFINEAGDRSANVEDLGGFILGETVGLPVAIRLDKVVLVVFINHDCRHDFTECLVHFISSAYLVLN